MKTIRLERNGDSVTFTPNAAPRTDSMTFEDIARYNRKLDQFDPRRIYAM